MSLQFDARVTLNEYSSKDEIKKLNPEFDYEDNFVNLAKTHLESALTQTPILINGDKVYVCTIAGISPVI